ncbi:MAG: phenylacetate--CoA ligase family protein [Pirellulales bacterium]|nr:phenylacetate--CoA ligase family protein [Pirellulales bacterium]
MWHKLIFNAGYTLKRPRLLKYFYEFQKSQWFPFERLKETQDRQLQKMVDFAFHCVPYYTKLFKQLHLVPTDISSVEHLVKLPILTKHIIKENACDFIPIKINSIHFINGSTGGSTGVPFKYRLEKADYERGVALLYRGWSYAGYRLGDPVAILAGSSLIPATAQDMKKKLQSYFLNMRAYSSYEMSEENLLKYYHDIQRRKPYFIRGYASSIYLFAKFIQDNSLKLKISLKAVFTTAEKLLKKQRQVIEGVFGVKVFDNYGLHDGGITAHECEKHCGMHIDMERSILECVDEQGNQTIDCSGKILATSLYNFAMPFLRYETGDNGSISLAKCSCGREMPMLKEIEGRLTDYLKLNNIVIGSPVLTILMGKCDIVQYQIIQTDANSILCKIIKEPLYTPDQEQFIRDSFFTHVGKINISFEYVDSIPTTQAGKYKFIINNVVQ